MRGGRDVDHEGHTALLGHLCDRPGSAGVERPDQTMRALLNESLGTGARGINVGFCVGVHQFDFDTEQLSDDRRSEVGALLARLADQALHARLRQQHADLQL